MPAGFQKMAVDNHTKQNLRWRLPKNRRVDESGNRS